MIKFFFQLERCTQSKKETSTTKTVIEKYSNTNGKKLTKQYLKNDVLQLTDIFKSYID